MRIARAAISVVYLALLVLAFAMGPIRYHLLGNQHPLPYSAPGSALVGRYVQVRAIAANDSALTVSKGPFQFRVLPLRDPPGLWVLLAAENRVIPDQTPAIYEGRLMTAQEVPFLRRELRKFPSLAPNALVVEQGHRPKRALGWGFIGAVLVMLVASQLLISLWDRIRKR